MSRAVRYSLARSEVWSWYVRMWRQRLWVFHVGLVAMIFAGALIQAGPLAARLAIAVIVSGLGLAAMVAYPQLAFKPQERWLQIGPDGLDTSIKDKSRSLSWSKVDSVVGLDEVIYVTMANRNGFIIPARAFASAADRAAFLADAQAWKQAAAL